MVRHVDLQSRHHRLLQPGVLGPAHDPTNGIHAGRRHPYAHANLRLRHTHNLE